MLRAVPHGSAVSRRSLLAGGALLVSGALIGCKVRDQPEPEPSGSPNPDEAALRAALTREDELLAAYATVGADATAANPELAEIVARHELHRTAISSALAAKGATTSPSPTASASGQPEGRSELAALEAAAAAAGRTAANQVSGADLAGLLAAIAAAENANAVELSE